MAITRSNSIPKLPKTPKSQTKPFVVVLSDIRSRENVGSIFRTADGAGVSKLFLCGITPRPPHEKISKTALGAEDIVAWEYRAQTWRLLDQLKREGHLILFLEQTSQSKNIFEYKIDKNLESILTPKIEAKIRVKSDSKNVSKYGVDDLKNADGKTLPKNSLKEDAPGVVLVLGNEVSGISQKLLNYATDAVEIPMYGTKESLNVAVAFGIAVYALKAK